MNDQTDSQLLRAYAECRSEPAFAELVRRNVDLVHSAALRMVCDSHLAQDVTQAAFLALAKNAAQLTDHPVLSGWLHRTAHNIAAQTVRTDVRRRAREQEAVIMNKLLAIESDADWKQIAPHLDAALDELNDPDRDALLLRYFEHKSAREMAQTLGTSEEAAQKRVSRAVERLREFLAKRGIAIGASGLGVIISANAVQAAPTGLAISITAAAAVAGTTIAATTTATIIKAIAMTTLQKTLVTAVVAAAVGTGIYEARQTALLRTQVQDLQQQQAPLTAQVQQMQQERDEATNRLVSMTTEIAQLKSNQNQNELLKLRGEVSRLRAQSQVPQSKMAAADPDDPATQQFLAARAIAQKIAKSLQDMPDKRIPELALMTDVDWLSATKEAKFDTDADVRKTLRKVRDLAKQRLPLGRSLSAFTQANNGRLPSDLSQLKPYFQSALGDTPIDSGSIDAIFQRYTLLHTGNVADYPADTWFIGENAPVDKDYDSRAKFGIGSSSTTSTGIGEAGDPDAPSY